MHEEYWDIYTMDGSFVETIRKGAKEIPATQYHTTVEVIPTDGHGHLLVTRRSPLKRRAAGRFEFPAGSVQSGEMPVAAAQRELLEETGLEAKEIILIDEVIAPGIKRIHFIAIIPDLTNTRKIHLQEGETSDFKLITAEQWLDMIHDTSFDLSRCEMYTDKVYNSIREVVGESTEVPAKPQEKQVHACPILPPEQKHEGKQLAIFKTDLEQELVEGKRWSRT